MTTAAGVSVDLANVQGLLYQFYPCECSRYLLLHFDSTRGGRTFLRGLLPLVTPTVKETPANAKFLNVGLTFEGLTALALDAAILKEFPDDFKDGPSATVMGDFGDSAPAHWWSGRQPTTSIHALVQLTCHSSTDIESATDIVRTLFEGNDVRELPATPDGQPIDGRHLGKGRLHFGYRDGISQPQISWADGPLEPNQLNFRNFLLGYSTPDVPSSPKHVASRPASSQAAALARDGYYAVFRWIYQDVARFNAFLETEGPKLAPDRTPQDAQELLAAKLMGRWRDGTPLVLSPDAPDADMASSDSFGYASDTDGRKCPFAAHVRVVNPRDQPLDAREFGVVPRVVRRGTPFGEQLEGTTDDGMLRGLVGVFLCSSISAQVYKLMAWMKRTDFSPLLTNPVGQDPLGNRQIPGASNAFEIPTSDGIVTIGLQNFTRTLGTAFFLIPSISTLAQLSER